MWEMVKSRAEALFFSFSFSVWHAGFVCLPGH